MIHTPTLAIDHVSPETAARYLAIFEATEDRYPPLTPHQLRDLRYRVAYAMEHGTPIVLSPRDAVGLILATEPNAGPSFATAAKGDDAAIERGFDECIARAIRGDS